MLASEPQLYFVTKFEHKLFHLTFPKTNADHDSFADSFSIHTSSGHKPKQTLTRRAMNAQKLKARGFRPQQLMLEKASHKVCTSKKIDL